MGFVFPGEGQVDGAGIPGGQLRHSAEQDAEFLLRILLGAQLHREAALIGEGWIGNGGDVQIRHLLPQVPDLDLRKNFLQIGHLGGVLRAGGDDLAHFRLNGFQSRHPDEALRLRFRS